MMTNKKTVLAFFCCTFLYFGLLQAQVSAESLLGLPRATTAEINAVVNPQIGALVYNTDDDKIYRFTATGWQANTDDQVITDFNLDDTNNQLTLSLEDGGTQTVDFTTVLAAAGTDDQEATEVNLTTPIDIDNDATDETTVEGAINALNTRIQWRPTITADGDNAIENIFLADDFNRYVYFTEKGQFAITDDNTLPNFGADGHSGLVTVNDKTGSIRNGYYTELVNPTGDADVQMNGGYYDVKYWGTGNANQILGVRPHVIAENGSGDIGTIKSVEGLFLARDGYSGAITNAKVVDAQAIVANTASGASVENMFGMHIRGNAFTSANPNINAKYGLKIENVVPSATGTNTAVYSIHTGLGQHRFGGYGTATHTGTPAGLLGVEADGDVIEVDPGTLDTNTTNASLTEDGTNLILTDSDGGTVTLALADIAAATNTNTTNASLTEDGTNLILTDSDGGTVTLALADIVGTVENLYTADGTLTGNRAITQNNFDLNFDANTLVVSGDDDRVGVGVGNPTRKLEVNGIVGVFDGSRATNAGMATEVSGGLINLGTNDGPTNRFGGTYNDALQGGFVRMDSRNGRSLFQIKGRQAGATTEVLPLMDMEADGALRLNQYGSGGFTGTATGFLGVDANGNVIETAAAGLTPDGDAWGVAGEDQTSDVSRTGNITINNSRKNALTLKVDANTGSNGLAFQNTGGNYTWNISRVPNALNDADGELVFSGGTSSPEVNTLAERMRLDQTGRLGLNTNDPTARLDVNGGARIRTLTGGIASDVVVTADANGNLRSRTAAEIVAAGGGNVDTNTTNASLTEDGTNLILTDSDGGTVTLPLADIVGTAENLYSADGTLTGNRTVTQNANTLAFTGTSVNSFSVDGTTLSVDAENDRVGIGTSTPETPFHVAVPASGGNFLLSGANAAVFHMREDDSNNSWYFVSDGADLNIREDDTSNANTRFAIQDGGNVGIGTTVPTRKLEVRAPAGEAIIRVGGPSQLGGSIELGNQRHGVKRGYNAVGNDVGLFTSSGNIHLSTNNNAGDTPGEFILTDNGNVGIGTATPTQTLTVDGNITTVENGQTIQFPHTNAFNGDDGKIGSGNFAEGLNIVGTQTVSGNGRKVAIFGDASIVNGGDLEVTGSARVATLPGGAVSDGIVTADANGNLRQRTLAEVAGAGADGDAWGVTGEDVASDVSRTGGVRIGNLNGATGAKLQVGPTTRFPAGVTAPETLFRIQSPATSGVKYATTADLRLGDVQTGINTRAQLDFALSDGATNDANNTVMTLLGNGRVGIGTSTPTSALSVAGGINTARSLELGQLGSGNRTTFIDFHAEDGVDRSFRLRRFEGANGDVHLENQGTGAIRFLTDGGTTRMTIGSSAISGNVGVGVGNPTRKLEVNGIVGVFDGSRATNAGMATEVSGGLINLGTNDGPTNRFGGTYNDALQGGFVRMDSRNGRSLFQIKGRQAGATTEVLPLMDMEADGALRLNQYGSGGFTGTATGFLGVDANGNVIETAAAGLTPDGDAWGVAGEDQTSNVSRTGNITINNSRKNALTLQVDANAGSNGLAFQNTGGNYTWNISRVPNALNDADGELVFSGGTNSPEVDTLAERMRLDETGRLGLNTNDPSERLDVAGNIEIDKNDNADGSGGKIQLVRYDAAGISNGSSSIGTFSDVTTSGLVLSGNFNAGAGVNDHLFIEQNTGNVGIGTTTPTRKLEVRAPAGEAIIRVAGPSQNGGAIEFGNQRHGVKRGYNAVGNDVGLFTSSGNIHLSTNNNTGDTPGEFILTDNGNVGIGTTAPTQKLHVAGGNILVTGGSFIDDGTTLTAPDYVFEKYFNGSSALKESYDFNSLESIEAYVKQNKHLPGIKSAYEIQEDGWDISFASRFNLEKVEELFLHTIEQDKKIKTLHKENELLKERLDAIEKMLQKQ